MKINNDNPDLSALFQARVNPWAPKYEQKLWNDCSVGQFSAILIPAVSPQHKFS